MAFIQTHEFINWNGKEDMENSMVDNNAIKDHPESFQENPLNPIGMSLFLLATIRGHLDYMNSSI